MITDSRCGDDLAEFDPMHHYRPAGPCDLCPTTDGVRPMAMVRAWVALQRWSDSDGRSRSMDRCLDLCISCLHEVAARGDLVPGAEVVVL